MSSTLSRTIRSTLRVICNKASTSTAATTRTQSSRLFSSSSRTRTSATASQTPLSYPFASAVQVLPPTPATALPAHEPTSLLRTLNLHLTSQHPLASRYSILFSRRHKERVRPGSVLTVISYTSLPTSENPSPSTTTFSGVLMAMRRRHAGRDTSIRLRNLVGRTGVEMSYKVFSPMIKEIKVVQAATMSGPPVVAGNVDGARRKPVLKASKRAKMYFVRDQPDRLAGVSGIVKQAREREALLEKRRR